MYALGYSIAYSDGIVSGRYHTLSDSYIDHLVVSYLACGLICTSPDTGTITKLVIRGCTFIEYSCHAMTTLTLSDCSFDCSHDDCYYTFKWTLHQENLKFMVAIMTNSVQMI